MHGWFQDAATINPLSHMIEGLRHQVISGLDVGELSASLAIAAGFFVFGLTMALLALRRRLARS